MTTFPRHAQLLLTERCNLACIHCAVPAEDSPATRELATDEWRRVIDLLAARRIDTLTIAGGEALLRRDATVLARAATLAGIPQVTIVSNGALPAERVPRELADLQRDTPVRVHLSVDGASAATHDAVRGDGSFDRTMRFAGQLREAGGRVDGLQCVLSHHDIGELDAIADLAETLGCRFLVLFPLGPVGRGGNQVSLGLSRTHWLRVLLRADDWRTDGRFEVHVHGPILGREWPVRVGELVPRPASAHGEMVVVGPDGEMFTCPPLRHIGLGNILMLDRAGLDDAFARAEGLMRRACAACQFRLMCCGVATHEALTTATEPFGSGDPSDVVAGTV